MTSYKISCALKKAHFNTMCANLMQKLNPCDKNPAYYG